MSEIRPTGHKSITVHNFPQEGFREADSEAPESEKDIRLLEGEWQRRQPEADCDPDEFIGDW